MSEEDLRRKRRVRRTGYGSPDNKSKANNVYSFDDYNKRSSDNINESNRAPNKRDVAKRKKKANQMRLISAFVFALFLVYICVYIGKSMNKEKISETKIIIGSIEKPNTYTGIIVRDEKTYKSKADGVSVYIAADGDRVKKGTVVCGIQDKDKVQKLEDSLSSINKDIINMQENRKEFSIYESDIKDANAQIKKIIDNESYKSAILDIGQVYQMREKVQQKLNMRNKMLLNENKGSLVGLVKDKENIESKISAAISNVVAEETGIVSYSVDGLEDILTIDNLYNLTKDQTTGKPDTGNSEDSNTVAVDDIVFKIIKSNNWYIAAYLPVNETEEWYEGGTETIYIQQEDDFVPYEAAIDKLIPTSKENEIYVVFKCNKLLIDYLNQRSVSFKTTLGINEGLKIPNTAIADKTLLKIPNKYVFDNDTGGTKGSKAVMKQINGENTIVTISITSSDDEYIYVLQDIGVLKFGDVLVNGQNTEDIFVIEEVKNVKGVYVTNSGVMVFKEINFEEQLASNNTYTIIDPALNTSIKNQDRIISDVKTLSSNKKVY